MDQGTPLGSIEESAALADELCELGRRAGLDAVGIAEASPFTDTLRHLEERRSRGFAADMQFTYRNPERSTDPQRILVGARSLVVGALRIPAPRTGPQASDEARVAAFAREDHYGELRRSLEGIAERLREHGRQARVVADDNALVDREAAVRAGIGWYGKNANVLLPGRGSWFVLGSVVTDTPLPPSTESVRDGCGTCDRCITGCPTGAIVEPGVVDARRCLAWLVQAPGSIPVEFRQAVGDRLYGCDDCQEVCPVGHGERDDDPGTTTGAVESTTWILEASDADLLDRFGHWYIAERDPRYLRRNALVVLGNATDGAPEVDAMLHGYAESPDPMLRGHAEWALVNRSRVGQPCSRSATP